MTDDAVEQVERTVRLPCAGQPRSFFIRSCTKARTTESGIRNVQYERLPPRAEVRPDFITPGRSKNSRRVVVTSSFRYSATSAGLKRGSRPTS